MLFNSAAFAIFLPVVFVIYWNIPGRFQWVLILISSCFFYMCWNPRYLVLILADAGVAWGGALLIEQFRTHRKFFLNGVFCFCFGILFFFKYFNFLVETLQNLNGGRHNLPLLNFVLPVGISFYTFQAVGYVIDVYRGDISAERNFGRFAAFLTFFPQLVAGPIERTKNLLPQIKSYHIFNYSKASYGMKLMTWGYFKKLVIADNLAVYADIIFNDVKMYSGLSLILAVVFFAIQIYCDFSGYSDIAIGTAKLFDIDLMRNFSSPYLSLSLKEFWSRWHISLSSWFRDYVYIPLGGNRKGTAKKNRNLLVTFLASGLWHGANWTFVLWGGLHGLLQIVENFLLTKKKGEKNIQKQNLFQNEKIRRLIRMTATFILVSALWIFFRADSLGDACYVFLHAFDGVRNIPFYIINGYRDMQIGKKSFAVIIVSLLMLLTYDYYDKKTDIIIKISSKRYRWAVYYAIVLLIIFFGNFGNNQFVYFQF